MLRGRSATSMRLPKRLGANLDGAVDDEDQLRDRLPFVNLETGLSRRLLNRDPISGLGELPDEVDFLRGSRLKGVMNGSVDTSRNPILLQGDLGPEFNCLYTTKNLVCRSRDDRDIITLQGDLGEELDLLRPNGGPPRHKRHSEVIRDPISGQGDFGSKEWDPIWEYRGRLQIKRHEEKKRDPISHSTPAENMGEKPTRCTTRQFPEVRAQTDPISHAAAGEGGNKLDVPLRTSKRFQRGVSLNSDPLSLASPPDLGRLDDFDYPGHTELALKFLDLEDLSVTGRKIQRRQLGPGEAVNPITHCVNPIPKEFLSQSCTSIDQPGKSETLDVDPNVLKCRSLTTKFRNRLWAKRDPISGAGLDDRDYSQSLSSPEAQPFRKFTGKSKAQDSGKTTSGRTAAKSGKPTAAGSAVPKKVEKPVKK